MIRRRRHARFPPASGAAGGDTEALQTDVMRFMSIIGLCLMAVFALVQVIPVAEPGKSAQPAQTARIQQEIKGQQQQVRELQAELHALKTEMLRTRRVLTVAQQHLEQVAGQTQQARAERDRLEAQIDTRDRQLEQERQALADMEQLAEQKEQNLDELRGRLLDTQVQLDRSRTEIEALKRRVRQQAAKPVIEKRLPPAPVAKPVIEKQPLPAPVAKPVIEKRPPPAPTVKPVSARQGFTLRFASADALDRLVAAGSVTLYAMADQQAWRLSMDAGRSAVARASLPGWFHEMSAVTVPAHYIYSLENAAYGPGQSSVVWGVQLPAATKAAIASLTRGQQGGALVIRGDGQVIQEE